MILSHRSQIESSLKWSLLVFKIYLHNRSLYWWNKVIDNYTMSDQFCENWICFAYYIVKWYLISCILANVLRKLVILVGHYNNRDNMNSFNSTRIHFYAQFCQNIQYRDSLNRQSFWKVVLVEVTIKTKNNDSYFCCWASSSIFFFFSSASFFFCKALFFSASASSSSRAFSSADRASIIIKT